MADNKTRGPGAKPPNKVRAEIHRTELAQRKQIVQHNKRQSISPQKSAGKNVLPPVANKTETLSSAAKASTAQRLGLSLVAAGTAIKQVWDAFTVEQRWGTYGELQKTLGTIAVPGEKMSFVPKLEGGILKSVSVSSGPQPQLVDGSNRPKFDPFGQAASQIQDGGQLPYQQDPPTVAWIEKQSLPVTTCDEGNLLGKPISPRRSDQDYRLIEEYLMSRFGQRRTSPDDQQGPIQIINN